MIFWNVPRTICLRNIVENKKENINPKNINNINNIIKNNSEEISLKPIKPGEKKYRVPGMTSNQLIRQLEKYSKIQHELIPSSKQDKLKERVKKNIIKNIEDRMKKVEIEFKIKMEEKFKKEEDKIKEEENRIKIEKEEKKIKSPKLILI